MTSRGIAAAAVAFLGVLAAVTTWFIATQSVESLDHETTISGEPQFSSLTEHPQDTRSPVAADSAPSTPLDVLDLAYPCPSLRHGKLAEGCMEVLDQRFLDREPYSGPTDWLVLAPIIRLDTRMTWDRVFLAPLEKRSRVVQALSDPMCRPEQGVYPERFEHCGASDMAELATLKMECGGHGFMRRLHALNWEVNEQVAALGIDGVEDTSSYWEYRKVVEDNHYQDAWLMARCLAVPTEAWRPTGAHESLAFEYRGPPWENAANPHDVVSSRDKSQDRRWLEHNISQEKEGHRLMLTAARLGSEWALAQVTGMSIEEFADEMDVAHPVLGQIMRVKHYSVGSMDDATKRAYRSWHADSAVRLAEDHGIELDMTRLSALVEGRTSLYTRPPTPRGRPAVYDESIEWVVEAIRKDGGAPDIPDQ